MESFSRLLTETLGRRVDFARWQIACFLALVAIGLGASVGLGWAVLRVTNRLADVQNQQTQLVTQLQTNRVQSIADLCRRDNRDNVHNIQFLQALGRPKAIVDTARRIYKLNPDCDAYARSIVRPKPGHIQKPFTNIPQGKP